MAKFYVTTVVSSGSEVIAETKEQAEQIGWDYDGEIGNVVDVIVEELDDEED